MDLESETLREIAAGVRLVATLTRAFLLFLRAVPPPVSAFLLLFVLFPGPLPAALALGLYDLGILGRLMAESVENFDDRAGHALRASGATSARSFLSGMRGGLSALRGLRPEPLGGRHPGDGRVVVGRSVRYRDLIANPRPGRQRRPPPGTRGRPPSLERPPAGRPWRASLAPVD